MRVESCGGARCRFTAAAALDTDFFRLKRERDGGTRPLRFSFALKHHPIGHIIHFIKPVFDFPPRFKIGRGFKESYGRLIDAV